MPPRAITHDHLVTQTRELDQLVRRLQARIVQLEQQACLDVFYLVLVQINRHVNGSVVSQPCRSQPCSASSTITARGVASIWTAGGCNWNLSFAIQNCCFMQKTLSTYTNKTGGVDGGAQHAGRKSKHVNRTFAFMISWLFVVWCSHSGCFSSWFHNFMTAFIYMSWFHDFVIALPQEFVGAGAVLYVLLRDWEYTIACAGGLALSSCHTICFFVKMPC